MFQAFFFIISYRLGHLKFSILIFVKSYFFFKWNDFCKKYSDHQTLGRWVVRPSNQCIMLKIDGFLVGLVEDLVGSCHLPFTLTTLLESSCLYCSMTTYSSKGEQYRNLQRKPNKNATEYASCCNHNRIWEFCGDHVPSWKGAFCWSTSTKKFRKCIFTFQYDKKMYQL